MIKLVGFILHAGIICFISFLLFHMAHLLFALAFPFKARNFMSEYSKIAHITELILVFVLSALPCRHSSSYYLQIPD